MWQYGRCGRGLALGIAAAMGVWSLQAEAITYNVTIVQLETGQENYNFMSGIYTGSVGGVVRSSNLPLALATSSASYQGVNGVAQGVGIGGTWTLSDGSGSDITGSFANLNRGYGGSGMPLAYGTGTSTISGGTGLFQDASGAGTFEVFARDGFGGTGAMYEQIIVNRLQITLPNGPVQTDTRNVAVSMRLGVNDSPTQTGVNIGGPTSDDAPLSNPRLTQLRSEYEYAGPPGPHDGLSFNRNVAGDGQDWKYDFLTGSMVSNWFFGTQGSADMLKGYGFYEGYTGHTEWIAFEVGMGPLGPDKFTYSNVAIDRYTLSAPVPEPETYALMFVGLAVLGLTTRRRRTRH